ncbi:MAG: PD40 domain-containing protein [Bacteroidetes bacterium]|nr:PD40 domain-containing protein [Bacteroidota bacterium]
MKYRNLFIAFLFFSGVVDTISQTTPTSTVSVTNTITRKYPIVRPVNPATSKDAKDNFTNGNYLAAMGEYIALCNKEPANFLYNFRAGVCYLNTNIEKQKAITYLEKASTLTGAEKEVWLELGKAYHINYKFDEAIEAFTKYKTLVGEKSAEGELTNRLIEICLNAKEFVKVPINVKYENLGKDINSDAPDYYPFVTADESSLIFTTRRKGTVGGLVASDGFNTSDVFTSLEKAGKWTKAKSAGSFFNSDGQDEATFMTSDGNAIFIYSENEFEYGDMLVSTKKGKSYSPRILIEPPVNSDKSEGAASITPDGNTIVFSSNRAGGKGDMDIYISRKLPSGKWGLPQNLGNSVNTKYIEDFPIINEDGTSIFFASQGHTNMGGFDIFKSTYNELTQEWSKAVNLGYPLNTTDDNMTICYTNNGKNAYVSAYRPDAIGDLDIYRLTFEDMSPKFVVIKGQVKTDLEVEPFELITLNTYRKGTDYKDFPTNLSPDKEWVFVESKKVKVKESEELKFTLTCDNKGVEKVFDQKNFPKTDLTIKIKNSTYEIAKKINFKPSGKKMMEANPLTPDNIQLTDKTTGTIYGTYKTVGETGKFILIVQPGKYELEIDAPGFKAYKEVIDITGIGNSQNEVERNFSLKK